MNKINRNLSGSRAILSKDYLYNPIAPNLNFFKCNNNATDNCVIVGGCNRTFFV